MRRLVTLTLNQRTELIRRYKTEKNPRLRDRIHCVLLKADGRTSRQVAAILLTSERTVNDWLNRFDAGGLRTRCAWDVGGSEARLTSGQLGLLRIELDKHLFQTARQVAAWVAEHYQVPYSERGNARSTQTPRIYPPESPPDSRPSRIAGSGGFFKRSMTGQRQSAAPPRKSYSGMRCISCIMSIRAVFGRGKGSVPVCMPIRDAPGTVFREVTRLSPVAMWG